MRGSLLRRLLKVDMSRNSLSSGSCGLNPNPIIRIIVSYERDIVPDFAILCLFFKSLPGLSPRGWVIRGVKIMQFLRFFHIFLHILNRLCLIWHLFRKSKNIVFHPYVTTLGVLRDIIRARNEVSKNLKINHQRTWCAIV